jgi:subtilisin-like proprotein convertase family protein
MDAHKQRLEIAAVLIWAVWFCWPAYGLPVQLYGGDFDLPIPAGPADTRGWMQDAVIQVPDHFSISDVDIRINVTHTNVFDLQISIKGPHGPLVHLNKYDLDEFFDEANYTLTIFDDEADIAIEQGEPPFTGRFRPRAPNLLQVYDGRDAFGLWRLRIYDAWYADTGTLDSFELIFATPEPTVTVFMIFGLSLMRALRRYRG